MADDTSNITTGRLRRFDRAVRAKWNKYIWSGIAIIIVGLLVLILTTALVEIGKAMNILLLGLGILLIIIGIIRLLIGIINPASPLDIAQIPVEEPERSLHQDILPPLDPASE